MEAARLCGPLEPKVGITPTVLRHSLNTINYMKKLGGVGALLVHSLHGWLDGDCVCVRPKLFMDPKIDYDI